MANSMLKLQDDTVPAPFDPKTGFKLMSADSTTPIAKPALAAPTYAGPAPAKPKFGYEAYVEQSTDLGGGLRGKHNPGGGGRLVVGSGKYKGLTRPEASEAIRQDYANMSPADRAEYENRATLGDVRSPAEKAWSPANGFTPGGQRDTGAAVTNGINSGEPTFSAPLQTPDRYAPQPGYPLGKGTPGGEMGDLRNLADKSPMTSSGRTVAEQARLFPTPTPAPAVALSPAPVPTTTVGNVTTANTPYGTATAQPKGFSTTYAGPVPNQSLPGAPKTFSSVPQQDNPTQASAASGVATPEDEEQAKKRLAASQT